MRLEFDYPPIRELKVGTVGKRFPNESKPECLAPIPQRKKGRGVREHKSDGGLSQLIDSLFDLLLNLQGTINRMEHSASGVFSYLFQKLKDLRFPDKVHATSCVHQPEADSGHRR